MHGPEHSQVAKIRSLPPRTGNEEWVGRSHPEKPKSPQGRAGSKYQEDAKRESPAVHGAGREWKKNIEEVESGI